MNWRWEGKGGEGEGRGNKGSDGREEGDRRGGWDWGRDRREGGKGKGRKGETGEKGGRGVFKEKNCWRCLARARTNVKNTKETVYHCYSSCETFVQFDVSFSDVYLLLPL